MLVKEIKAFFAEFGPEIDECELVIEASKQQEKRMYGSQAAGYPKLDTIHRGFDWDSPYVVLHPSENLKVDND